MRSLLSTKIIATLVLIMLSIGVVGFFVSPVYAQFDDPAPTAAGDPFNVEAGSFDGILKAYEGGLIEFITRVVQYLLGFLGIVVVLILIYGGYVWMTSGGDPDKVAKAKLIIRNAIIGLIIILTSYAIVSLIFNTFYGNSGQRPPQPCPGCDGDTWRSGIGVGPIESVYPAPRQTDVPINTMIAVTFKEEIDQTSVCQVADCNGETMTDQIEICELVTAVDGENVSYNCATEGDFETIDFADSSIWSKDDGKTFVIRPSRHLGLEDFADRNFYVVLKNGIKSKATGESIFATWKGDQYGWSFTTNGELDLDPPEIVSTNEALNSNPMSGVFPNPDGSADGYSQANPPKARTFTLTRNGAGFVQRLLAGYTQPASGDGTTAVGTLTGSYGGNQTGLVTVTIDSGSGAMIVDVPNVPDNLTVANDEALGQTSFALAGLGLTLTFNQVPTRGNSWTFNVNAPVNGDRLKVMRDLQVVKEYTFGTDATDPSMFQAPIVGVNPIIQRLVTDLPSVFVVNGGVLQTVDFGTDANRYNIVFEGSSALAIASVDGTDADERVMVNGQPDMARNAIVQVSFNEAINPIAIEDSFVVNYDLAGDGGVVAAATTLPPEIANQYRTVELRSSDQCGVNTCGGPVYCWPTNNAIATNPGDLTKKSTRYQVSVKAPALRVCQSDDFDWCSDWGGTCEQTSPVVGGRCAKDVTYKVAIPSIDGTDCTAAADNWCAEEGGVCEFIDGDNQCNKTISKTAYYNTASSITDGDGIMDMAGNSLNGSFNYYLDSERNNRVTGIAEGKSDIAPSLGGSSRPAYNLNDRYIDGTWYYPSTPVVGDVGTFGDSFGWGFYLSDKIDIRPPLVNLINPRSGDEVVNPKKSVMVTFSKIMRIATFKPGWNYGSDPVSRSVRYIILDTITRGFNPVGYWISGRGKDLNGDLFPDQTEALIEHNPFDAAALYGPQAGSGVEDAYQNCLLPGAGPRGGGAGQCSYQNDSGVATIGCVSDVGDTTLSHTPVNADNPASYSTLRCDQIVDANKCSIQYQGNVGCKALYATSTDSVDGSWIVTSDYQTYGTTGQGCCLGKCASKL